MASVIQALLYNINFHYTILLFMQNPFTTRTRKFREEQQEGTFGPWGPLLHRGVLVVLQSVQTLMLFPLLPCSWACSSVAILAGSLASGQLDFTIFCNNLIFDDIHFVVPWSRLISSLSSSFELDNSCLFLPSFTTGWSDEDVRTW